MRTHRFVLAIAALVPLLVAAPLAAGAEGAARLATSSPPVVDGVLSAEARVGFLAAGLGSGPPAQISLRLAAERVTVIVSHAEYRVTDTPLGEVARAPRYWNESYVLTRARIEAGAGEPGLRVAVVPASAASVVGVNVGEVDAAPLPTTRGAEVHYRHSSDDPSFFRAATGDGTLLLGASGVPGARFAGTAEGDLDVFLARGNVRVEGAEGARAWRLAETRERSPVLGSPAGEWVDRYSFATLRVEGATLALDADASEDAVAALVHPTAHVVGEARFRDATGAIRDGDRVLAVSGETVAIEGDLRVRFLPTASGRGVHVLEFEVTRAYDVRGAFDRVRIDALLFRSAPAPEEAAVAAVALALLASLLRSVRSAIGRALGAFYTRISREDVERSAGRRRLLHAIAAEPGSHLRGLQRATGLGWGTLSYHLTVLQRAGLVRLERRGRRVHVVPTGIRAEAAHFLGARGAASKVYAALAANGGLTQREVARATGISVALASHHLRALAAEGLVVQVAGWPKRYARR